MASIDKRVNKNGDIISFRIRISQGYDSNGKQRPHVTATYHPEKWMSQKQAEEAAKNFAEEYEKQVRSASDYGRKSNERYLFLGEQEEIKLLTCRTTSIEVPAQDDLDRLLKAKKYLLEIPCNTEDIIPTKKNYVKVRALDWKEMHDLLVGIENAYTMLANCKMAYDNGKSREGDTNDRT